MRPPRLACATFWTIDCQVMGDTAIDMWHAHSDMHIAG
jgi:hypothetical protein